MQTTAMQLLRPHNMHGVLYAFQFMDPASLLLSESQLVST
jgi:hypothetical protein